MYIQGKGKEEMTYDAIVIGSGISGGWAAKELCEKGLKTLVLDRGREVKHREDYPTTLSSPWEMEHRGRYPKEVIDKNPVQSKVAYAFNEYSGQFFIRDEDHPYVQEKPFDWIRGYQTGGKSLLWARWVQRWSDLDFEANAKEGIGVDWPIRYKDIAPWYSYVEKFIGVSGSKEGIPQLPDGEFLPPFEMNCIEKHFKESLKKSHPDRHYIISRTANLTKAQPHHLELGRSDCQSRNWCSRGCPYGAYFSTQSSTLPAAERTGNLTLRPDSVVHSIIYDKDKQKAIGVKVIDANSKEEIEYYAKIIFVNAATINTALILLNSTSDRFPEGLGNDRDILGRNLMDHNYRARVSGVFEEDIYNDKYDYGRRPAGTYLARFRNVTKKHPDFLRGYSIAAGGGRQGWSRYEEGFGAELKNKMTQPGAYTFGMTAMGEMLPNLENRMWVDRNSRDEYGLPKVHIDCEWGDNENAMTMDAIAQMQEMMEAAGIKVTNAFDNGQAPGLAIHEMGTARMGKDPKTSILNAFNQIHSCKNVFVTDGASMASSACQNPSITYMALTARAADHAVKELNKLNL